jgi:alpha-tubulin suppressor-like RCC1 family protein
VAVTVDGTLYTWGHGGYGQLGHDSRDNTQMPLLVTKFQEEGELCMTAEVRHVPAPADTVAIVSVRGTGSLPDTGMLEHGGSQENSNQRPEDSAIQESGFQKFVMSPRVSKVNTNTVHVLMAAVILTVKSHWHLSSSLVYRPLLCLFLYFPLHKFVCIQSARRI